MRRKLLMAVLAMLAATLVACADVKPECAGIFTDHMVLQRGKDIPVWGRAEPGTEVTAVYGSARATATADAQGDWTARFAELPVTKTGGELVVTIGSERKVFTDVLVGDVWLVSGQSNAEMTFGMLGHVVNEKAELEKSKDFPNVRAVKMRRTVSPWPVTYRTCNEPWCVATAKTLPRITAMGYFFARDINARTGIPIGIVDDNWAGQPIEMFLSDRGVETLAELENARKGRAAWREHCAKWHAKMADIYRGARPPEGFTWEAPEMPTESRIHNAMMLPIAKLRLAGVLWYQGCANESQGYAYEPLLTALVKDWRATWGAELPFYVVQLANYTAKTTDPAGGNGFAKVREAQRRAVAKLPRTGLAVAIDIGNAGNIHPTNKQDVGFRLARWARRDVYGEKIVVSGPLYREQKVEGDRIRLFFDHVGSGLCAADKDPNGAGIAPTVRETKALKGFAIAGADGAWVWADATIDGETVVVSSSKVAAPKAVRYAFRANPQDAADLYNREGLPASPFTTE